MQVRKLTTDDKISAGIISHIAFHARTDDPEKTRQQWLKGTEEDWGAFDEDGTLMARIINNRFQSRFDGHIIKNGGIGAVSTLPEYRESGAVRAIFANLLPEARRNGEVISSLYPFLHPFYRKFGYESVVLNHRYKFKPAELRGLHHTGWTRMWQDGDDVLPYLEIYEAFSSRFNLAICRDEALMKRSHLFGDLYKGRHFVYLLGNDEGAKAYVAFQDEFNPEAARLVVDEACWKDADGFRMALGFLSRFTADYGEIELTLPACIDLRLYAGNPYEITCLSDICYMVRVVNVPAFLSALKKPEGAAFVIEVTGDEQLPENNGVWRVEGEKATPCNDTPDLTVSVRALAQMGVGQINLMAAELREDVLVRANRQTLEAVFTEKPLYCGDHF